VTVVSGVNEEPEGIAHEGALAGGGRTIAVIVPRRVSDGGQRMFGLLRDGAHPVGGAGDVLEVIHGGRVVCGWWREGVAEAGAGRSPASQPTSSRTRFSTRSPREAG
jgi:hypothetical protein